MTSSNSSSSTMATTTTTNTPERFTYNSTNGETESSPLHQQQFNHHLPSRIPTFRTPDGSSPGKMMYHNHPHGAAGATAAADQQQHAYAFPGYPYNGSHQQHQPTRSPYLVQCQHPQQQLQQQHHHHQQQVAHQHEQQQHQDQQQNPHQQQQSLAQAAEQCTLPQPPRQQLWYGQSPQNPSHHTAVHEFQQNAHSTGPDLPSTLTRDTSKPSDIVSPVPAETDQPGPGSIDSDPPTPGMTDEPDDPTEDAESSKKVQTPLESASRPRKFVCTQKGCDKSFKTSGHLARHNRSHSAIKPFACSIEGCNSRFTRQDNMMAHYTQHLEKIQQQEKSADTTTEKPPSPPRTRSTTRLNRYTPYASSPRPYSPSPTTSSNPQLRDDARRGSHEVSQSPVTPLPTNSHKHFAEKKDLEANEQNDQRDNSAKLENVAGPTTAPRPISGAISEPGGFLPPVMPPSLAGPQQPFPPPTPPHAPHPCHCTPTYAHPPYPHPHHQPTWQSSGSYAGSPYGPPSSYHPSPYANSPAPSSASQDYFSYNPAPRYPPSAYPPPAYGEGPCGNRQPYYWPYETHCGAAGIYPPTPSPSGVPGSSAQQQHHGAADTTVEMARTGSNSGATPAPVSAPIHLQNPPAPPPPPAPAGQVYPPYTSPSVIPVRPPPPSQHMSYPPPRYPTEPYPPQPYNGTQYDPSRSTYPYGGAPGYHPQPNRPPPPHRGYPDQIPTPPVAPPPPCAGYHCYHHHHHAPQQQPPYPYPPYYPHHPPLPASYNPPPPPSTYNSQPPPPPPPPPLPPYPYNQQRPTQTM
ncbi:hypothetical protein DFS34DRAFT_647128 [Phlyctochytrium arcticum]|nr:hypothetical protein DFS34DRAFT_647128 [Phlyctochytrium arcticum]